MRDLHNEGSFQATRGASAPGKAWPAHAVTAGNPPPAPSRISDARVRVRVQAWSSGPGVKGRVLSLDEAPPVVQRKSHQVKAEMTRHNHPKQEAHPRTSHVLRTLPSTRWRAGAGVLCRRPRQPSLLLAPRLQTPRSPLQPSEPTCEIRKTHFQRTKKMHYPNKSGEVGPWGGGKEREEVRWVCVRTGNTPLRKNLNRHTGKVL